MKSLGSGFRPAARLDLRRVRHQFGRGQEDHAGNPAQAPVAAACDFARSPNTANTCFHARGQSRELVHLIDVVTTNKTDFFREAGHFDYLVSKALPDLRGARRRQPEVADLERRMFDRRRALHAGDGAQRVCQDSSRLSVQRAGNRYLHRGAGQGRLGIFKSEWWRPCPRICGENISCAAAIRESDLVRVVPELRALIDFRRLNFMDADFGLTETPEIIFCRNVIIYFDRPTQERLLEKLTRQLAPGGYFFAGHSESLQGMDLPLVPVAPAVYRKRG